MNESYLGMGCSPINGESDGKKRWNMKLETEQVMPCCLLHLQPKRHHSGT